MEAETLLALGDALAARGHEDAAGDAWQHAAAIFSAFLLPERRDAKPADARANPAVPERG
jgi:hypothetical protein